jgi:pimeloyl-ACP methyl ester carboxylesterase
MLHSFQAFSAAPSTPETVIRRSAFYLESRPQPIFSWLHRPERGITAHGVILCPPVGHEQVHSHRGLRHLADALARAGYPTLRLDYHGTGDSAGSDTDADLCATRIANIQDAHRWMTRSLGCSRITLVGLRLGALLAAEAAKNCPVDGLVLWAPVGKGRSYVREMKALALTTSALPTLAGAHQSITEEDLEPAGFVLTAETARNLSQLDLAQARPQCRRVLILERDDVPSDLRLLETLQSLAVPTQQIRVPGYTALMAEPHHTQVPTAAIAHIVEWLGTAPLSEPGLAGADQSTTGMTQDPEGPTELALPQEGLRERILHLGAAGNLFGIVSEPISPAPEHLPWVVLLNAGSSYRVGPNRLSTLLARQLAAGGFRCVRLDLRGLGDSDAADPTRENHPYPETTFQDIALALDHLHTQLGARRAVLMGLCSGAYAAFQSAARLPSPLLVEGIAINPLTFYWKDGMSLDVSPAEQLETNRAVLSSLLDPSKWVKVLMGRSKRGILGSLRSLGEAIWSRLRSRAPVRTFPDEPVLLSHPTEENLPGDLDRIVNAGRHMAFFFARSDPGHLLLAAHAGRKVAQLCSTGHLSLHFMDAADHTFSRRAARATLGQTLKEYLLQRYPAPGR